MSLAVVSAAPDRAGQPLESSAFRNRIGSLSRGSRAGIRTTGLRL